MKVSAIKYLIAIVVVATAFQCSKEEFILEPESVRKAKTKKETQKSSGITIQMDTVWRDTIEIKF